MERKVGPVAVLLTVIALAACSGDGRSAGPDAPAGGEPASTSTSMSPVDPAVQSESTGTVAGGSSEPAPSSPVTAESSGDPGALPTFTVVEVPETGVPGLDSDDSFCAAWSRFGGSWQVIQVAANFAPDPTVVPTMEVVAAPVIDAASEAMFAAWPGELDDERDAVADGFFGPLDRRADVALSALADAGATAADLVAIGAAWEAALATRQADDPVVTPELPDELWAIVDVAAADFDGRLVGFVDDPSMRIVVETPATDAHLATACPDQGALIGTEIDAG